MRAPQALEAAGDGALRADLHDRGLGPGDVAGEQGVALLRRQVPPFGAGLESRAGGRDGGVDVFFAGGFDGRDDGFVVGVDGFDFLARGGGDELVVDEEAFVVAGVSVR